MSQSSALTLRDESSVNYHPGLVQSINTNCIDGLQSFVKKFKEVFIHWNGAAWVEDAVYNPLATESQVVLRIDNQCTGHFAYIKMPINDYRLLGLCCIDCPLPYPGIVLPDAVVGTPYNQQIHLIGAGPWQYSLVSKPAWMNAAFNATTGVITLTGTPTSGDLGDTTFEFAAASCNQTPDPATSVNYDFNVGQVLTFTARAAANANNWYRVAFGAGLHVAIAQQAGNTNQIMTSPDAITWTQRTSTQDVNWNDIIFANGQFVVIGTGANTVMTSPDGITWTQRNTPEVGQWRSIAYGAGLYVVVGTLGTNQIMTSPDGITWTSRIAPVLNGWYGVAWSSTLNLFAAVAQNGVGNRVMTSADGMTWTIGVSAADNNFFRIIFALGWFIAISATGANRVMVSNDGTTWTLVPSGNDAAVWIGIAFGNGLLVAVAASGTGDHIMYSSDVFTWFTSPYNFAGNGIGFGNNKFVVVGNNLVETAPWF